MRQLIFIISILFCLQGFSQSLGDIALGSKSIILTGIADIEIGIKAQIKIDCSGKEGIKVRAKDSLLEKVEVDLVGDRLYVNAKEWIAPEEEIYIEIGAPNLNFVQLNTNSEVSIEHIDQEVISAMALNGQISLSGKVQWFNANGEVASIDARELVAETVQLNFWDLGEVLLGSPKKLIGKTRRGTKVTYENQPKEKLHIYAESGFNKTPVRSKSSSKIRKVKNPDARFINFDLKNNSFNRIQCYVKGPKSDGSTFSYGFPMNPGQKRKKYWSIGTKVYRVNHMGMRKLLLEITSENEGQLVKMYEKE